MNAKTLQGLTCFYDYLNYLVVFESARRKNLKINLEFHSLIRIFAEILAIYENISD